MLPPCNANYAVNLSWRTPIGRTGHRGNSLWNLLVRIAVRKCCCRVAALHAERRDVRREVHARDSAGGWEALSRAPTPEEVASLTEILERLLASLDDRQRQIVSLRLQGYTVLEISQIGCTERTVHCLLARVRESLARWNVFHDPRRLSIVGHFQET